MAKHKLARRSASPVRRRSRTSRLARVAGRKVARHAKAHAVDRMGSLVGIGACAAVGYLERSGKMPSLGGYEPTLVVGLLLAFGVPMVVKGKHGQMAAEAGAALSGVAAYKLAAGAPLRVGYDDQVNGDDEVGYEVAGYAVAGDDD